MGQIRFEDDFIEIKRNNGDVILIEIEDICEVSIPSSCCISLQLIDGSEHILTMNNSEDAYKGTIGILKYLFLYYKRINDDNRDNPNAVNDTLIN